MQLLELVCFEDAFCSFLWQLLPFFPVPSGVFACPRIQGDPTSSAARIDRARHTGASDVRGGPTPCNPTTQLVANAHLLDRPHGPRRDLDLDLLPQRVRKERFVLDVGVPRPPRFVLGERDVVPGLSHCAMKETELRPFERLADDVLGCEQRR